MPEENPTKLQAAVAVFAGAIVVAGASWLAVAFTNGSRFWSPAPLPMVLPAWLIGESVLGNIDAGPALIPLIGAALFSVLGIPLALPQSKAVMPSLVFCGVVLLGSVIFFATSWSYGVKYQGLSYTVTLAVINLGLACTAVWLGLNAFRLRTYRYRFAFTLQLCTWFVWFAFPWLGEMP
jgi:hypothetical protein